MASHRCVCCKAHLYLQIGYGQATETVLPRCNSICGKQSAAEYTQRFRHLNRNKTRKIHCNLLKDFLLCGFDKHLPWFRCSGKVEHLNPAARWNQAVKQLTTSTLQDFWRLHLWFRSQVGFECRRMQMHSGGASCRGINQTHSRVAQASEPENNSNKPLQLVERLSVVRFQQASSPVQMQRKRGVSEPCIKAESGSQSIHNKRIAGLSATVPEVQMQAEVVVLSKNILKLFINLLYETQIAGSHSGSIERNDGRDGIAIFFGWTDSRLAI